MCEPRSDRVHGINDDSETVVTSLMDKLTGLTLYGLHPVWEPRSDRVHGINDDSETAVISLLEKMKGLTL